MEPFRGFADGQAKFFKRLAKNNEREWFQAHKAEFEAGWNRPMAALLAGVKQRIDDAYPHCDLEEPRIFRIYRDVRFSKDGSPYKTQLGGFIAVRRAARKTTDATMALYFQAGATRSFAGAGHYMMEPEALARFRGAVADEKRGQELTRILAALAKKGFPASSYESLKRVPKGFDPDHPRADLLKAKGLIVGFPELPKGIMATPKLTAWLATRCASVVPLVEWLAFATA